MKPLAVISSQMAEGGPAQAQCLFQHLVEHRGEVAGRGIDDLQDLGGRGLLFEGFARLGNEPRVLHRDDRLRGEVLQQRDLFVAERPYHWSVEVDSAKQRAVLAQRYIDRCPASTAVDQFAIPWIRPVWLYGGRVEHVNKWLSTTQAIDRTARRRSRRTLPPQPFAKKRLATHRDRMNPFAVEGEKVRVAGAAQMHRFVEHCIEHGGEIAGR